MKITRRISGSKAFTALALVLVLLAIAGLIAASPLGFSLLGGANGYWDRLSSIAQTYAAASALLSVLALIGVASSLVLQARETTLAREEARRRGISDLLKMAMDDPDLSECWGPSGLSDPLKQQRQHMYINMIVGEWRQSYETGSLEEPRLRAIAYEMMSGPPGRRYWEAVRDVRMSTSQGRAQRRFHQILQEEYERAPVPSEAETEAAGGGPAGGTRDVPAWARRLLWAGAGATSAVAVCGWLRRRG